MTPELIKTLDRDFRAQQAEVESLVERQIEHWQVHCGDLCPGDWCAGPLFDGALEELDSDELRRRLQAAVWQLAKLRAVEGVRFGRR